MSRTHPVFLLTTIMLMSLLLLHPQQSQASEMDHDCSREFRNIALDIIADMSTDEVVGILGDPIMIVQGEEFEKYHYKSGVLAFSSHGLLVDIKASIDKCKLGTG